MATRVQSIAWWSVDGYVKTLEDWVEQKVLDVERTNRNS